jgi:serine protease Do
LKHHTGGVESPTSLFLLSLISLFIGGAITWYFFVDEGARSIPDKPVLPSNAATTALDTALVGESPTAGNSRHQSRGLQDHSIGSSRENAIVRAAEEEGPAVVSINVLQTRIVQSGNPFFNDFWKDFFFPQGYKQQVQSLGSGFIISGDGHIFTNEHVVRDAEKITVILVDGREYQASILGSDKLSDLAILKIEADDLPVSKVGTSLNLLIGEWVIAIGNPFGYLLDDTQPTVTVGVVSALNRDIKLSKGESTLYADMIQTDASINPGNSGGPLVNSEGEVVGVNTFIFTKSGGSLGIGFAIPIDRAKRVYREILRYQRVLRPWIGIHPQDLNPSLRKGLELGDENMQGVIVVDVDDGSPAGKAGIQRGDVITRINGRSIRSSQDWEGLLLDIETNTDIDLEVYREGHYSDVKFETVPRPTDTAKKIKVDLGLILADIDDPIRSQLGLQSQRGALILEVTNPLLSEDNGLKPFDVILKVNNTDIRSAEEAKSVLKNLSRRRNSMVLERNNRLIYRSLLIG